MRVRRIEILLFVFAWLFYAYFHQGGGWNQNARFAMTRALVESRRPWIDDYLVYTPDGEKGSPRFRRLPVRDGIFENAGRSYALSWADAGGALTPLASDVPADARRVAADAAGATGDLSFARGHTHPNKAPGTSLIAIPGYAIVWCSERLLGIDFDAAKTLNVNAWLSGALSVGLVAALGVVMFWRVALRLSGDRAGAAMFATLGFAFGTLYFPYATMLYEHDLVAVTLLGAYLLVVGAPTRRRLFWAGAFAGAAIVSSYLSVIAAAFFGVYVAWRGRKLSDVAVYASGTIPPLAILAAYNLVCFGQLAAMNYLWENPLFRQGGSSLLELFTAPRWEVLVALLFSPIRGVFAGAPVLVLGVIGLISMLRQPRFRPEGLLCAAMIAHVLLFNLSFKDWHGGWTCGPRYLIPALPFLALPIAVVAPRAAWARGALLAVSITAMAIVTSVDPQPPVVISKSWTVSPIWDIDLPQFLHGRPGAFASATWPDSGIARYVEPVSANPSGVYEAIPGRFYPVGSPQVRWSSFNVGEVVFPGSRLSLVFWLGLVAVFSVLVHRELKGHAAVG
jgi:hypothetical protein